ncbi:amidohydrolase [Gordonia jinhuaensis]|nr:amidohydrolase [Gordonia jinhuaensis]
MATPLPSIIFHSGPIFDGHRLLEPGLAVGIRDGRVVALDTTDAVRAELPGVEEFDLAGRLLHPGFTDAHIHALSAGVDRNACDLTSAESEQQALQLVADYAARTDSEWIVGSGWTMAHFAGGCPTAASLDTVVADRPVFVMNRDHHGAWVNTRAMELAGITADTPDPADGRIERDADGVATGTLHEGAMDLVSRILPASTFAEQIAGLVTAQQLLHSYGITGWQEAIVGDYPGMADLASAYAQHESDGLLTAAVVGASWLPRPTTVGDVADVVAEFVRRKDAAAGGRWSMHSVKIMVDGVVENKTALMDEPYCGECACAPTGHGLAYFDPKVLAEAVIACDAAGLDVHFHAIGDGAVKVALDAVEAARIANGITGGRHHIAHLQLVAPADVPRFARLGVTVNMQALWACNDEQMIDLVLPVVGEQRYQWHYPFASLAATGAHLAMGSDWPVSTPDPWHAISVAVNRMPPGEDVEALLPAESLDVATALAAYTSGSAWINRRTGSGEIRIGANADLVVADRNPFEQPLTELWQTGTDLTVADGVIVYERTEQ